MVPKPGSAEENFGRMLHKDFGGYLRDELIISSKAGYFNVAWTLR
jgi:L-glyceraldehyde 3-phosphate reductase